MPIQLEVTPLANGRQSVNARYVEFGQLTIWFSYLTPIAFHNRRDNIRAKSENIWGPTTGRHLNAPGLAHFEKYPNDTFNNLLEAQLKHFTTA